MAAPKNNDFWKLRSRHGRQKLFKSPALMLEAAYEYFTWCEKNPWKKSEAIKSGEKVGKIIKVPTSRPFTLIGFCRYVGANPDFWRDFKSKNHKGFAPVIKEIEEIIYQQKFEGAAVGAFNANIIARDLGLTDKKDVTTNGESLNKGFYDYVKAVNTKKK